MNNQPLGYAMILLFHIGFYSILPIIIIFISHSFGEKILTYIPGFVNEQSIFKSITSIGTGFFLFVTILTLLSFAGLFTPIFFFIVLGGISIFCYKNITQNFSDVLGLKWELDAHDFNTKNIFRLVQPHTLTTEFLFIVLTALISVNLINIVRPFPIGWDDLGVYMNYANMIGNSGKMFFFGQMSSWQVFTGIGYMFGSSSQAFFLNSFSGIISTLMIIFTIKYFVKSDREEEKSHFFGILHKHQETKHFLNIPLLMGTIYVSLPMVIFHLAKDMKLDQGLLFVSISGIFIIYYILASIEKRTIKNIAIYLLIAGLILGFAFSIKLTTLLLISSTLGILTYSQMGISGFIAFASFFFAFFTKFGLWEFLNVVYPKNDIFLINIISGSLALIGTIALILSIKKNGKDALYRCIKMISSVLIGIIIALLPWLFWNLQSTNDISLSYLINGKADSYTPDYTLIRGEEYVNKIKQEFQVISSSGKALSEDYGRYFGYENGINNYLKIFWNVSMQVNQRGEFTEISYLFFALIPSLLLFLPIRNKIFEYGIYTALGISVLTFMIGPSSVIITNILSQIELPLGYAFLIVPYLVFILFSLGLGMTQSKIIKFFVLNSIMMSFYVFLWTLSSFGIVWYGMAMYYFFLITMSICLYFLSAYTGEVETRENKVKAFASYIIFGIISVYFIFSSFPHLFINLQVAGYPEFKIGSINEKESIFLSHEEYLDFLFELNIDDAKKSEFLEVYKTEFLKTISGTNTNGDQLKTIVENVKNINTFEKLLQNIISSADITDVSLKNNARKVKNHLYAGVIYPNERFANQGVIYRAGTFMKYFISNNIKRVYEDNLLDGFNLYIYDENTEIAVDRLKKLGVKNLLIDLNAATIDNDPRRALTKRYEQMLYLLTSDRLKYIGGDSICFSIALDSYKKSEKKEIDKQEFLLIAGSNYDSILPDGTTISRNQKLTNCFLKIKNIVQNNKVTETSPEVLRNIYNYVNNPANNIKTDQEWKDTIGQMMHPGFKVLFKVEQ